MRLPDSKRDESDARPSKLSIEARQHLYAYKLYTSEQRQNLPLLVLIPEMARLVSIP